MTFMPHGHSVWIEPRKLAYLLTTGKAGFFLRHGFDPARPWELENALRVHPLMNPYESEFITPHGRKYVIRCSMRSPDGRNPCALSVWMFDRFSIFGRLVTAYASPVI